MRSPCPYPNASHNRRAVNGIGGRGRSPSASAMAAVTAHNAPVVPASPMPFTPKGLNGEGVLHSSTS